MKNGKLRPIKIGMPGDEICKKDLLAVARRFQNLHSLQLQRIGESLNARQRRFLELLPLLFHSNHPLLPGFVTTETPAGIHGYHPGRQALNAALRLSKSFEYKRRALPSYPVQGIFLMGSVGSIAYSNKSDFDIWLCHDSGIEAEGLDELKQKATAIEAWGEEIGLEVHIFFINPEEFRAGRGQPISTESCGSIQHHLLLEEFYRTSLYIAGRIPGWWLTPPEQDQDYSAFLSHLLEKRFINESEIIDLGGLENVSADEFLGGTLWHLYKAVNSPHKSLLKLLLMESYASEYPRPDWLCTRLKTAVHDGNADINELDSYILIYRKVEAFLRARGESERLELARQCFYLKINELLSVPSTQMEKRYRREILQAMTHAWGWGWEHLRALDGRRRWRIGQVMEEQKVIAGELTKSYQDASRFAREQARQTRLKNDEIMLLGRRLYAALEHKPGKVEMLSSDGYERLEAEDFSLHEVALADGDDGWALFAGLVVGPAAKTAKPLKRARCLLEILAWLLLNGIYRRNRSIFVETRTSTLGSSELKSILDVLGGFLRRHGSQPDSLDVYGHPSRVEAAALFLNLGLDPQTGRKDGMQIASNRFDPLSYGASRVNMIRSVDQINLTSWQETLVHRQSGLTGLFDSLCALLSKPVDAKAPPQLECFSFGVNRGRGITQRIQQLYKDLAEVFQGDAVLPRYIVRGGEAFYVFGKNDGVMSYWSVPGEAGLLAELAGPRARFSPVVFDRAALETSPLPLIYGKNRRDAIQIFCFPTARATELFILDERGSLFHRIYSPLSPQWLLTPYIQFLVAIRRHFVSKLRGVECHLIDSLPGGGYELRSLPIRPEAVGGNKLSLRILGQEISPGRTAYSIYCNDKEFSSMDAGPTLFAQVAAHVLQLRSSGETYPIYITDLDVPASVLGVDSPEQLQTIHFLNYKQKIEDRLNG